MLTVISWLLVAVLAAAMIAFIVMGLGQKRRSDRLGRCAHNAYMQFSAADPFDMPQRYGASILVRSGHSAQAHNVCYGQVAGVTFRAFDFRCEAGHGTSRLTQHYIVGVIEMPRALGRLLMWNRSEPAPLEAMLHSKSLAQWSYDGSDDLAERLGHACRECPCQGLSIEVDDHNVLLYLRASSKTDYQPLLQLTPRIVAALGEGIAAGTPV